MGLQFARSTEGAREAVQAIKIALGANPSLSNTKEGNLKIIDLMDQSAQYQVDKLAAADAYERKNGHYVGFESWWDKSHPVSQYLSQAVPYQIPKLQSGRPDGSK